MQAIGRRRSGTLTILGVVLCVVIAAIYWPGPHGGFFFDDWGNILDSKAIQIHAITLEAILDILEDGNAGPLGRPISLLSFAANYYFSGFSPFAFKLTNTFIHALNCILVFRLVHQFVRAAEPSRPRQYAHWAAAAIAGLWAIHPIQMTSVLYVVQRMTSLSATFVLISLILHIWVRQRGKFDRTGLVALALAWTLFFPLGLLSKETALIFVFYVATYESILHRYLIGRFDVFGTWFLRLFAVFSALSLLYLFSPAHDLLRGYDLRDFTLTQRLLTESRVIWQYIHLIYLPRLTNFGLYHDDILLSTGLFSPISTFFSIFGLVVLGVVSWLARVKWPLVAFSILWFLAGHCLESSILPLELMHEHRNYLPSLGPLILLVFTVPQLAKFGSAQGVAAYLGVFAFGAYVGLLSYLRSDMYGDDYRRTQMEAQYHPASVRAQYEAGAVIVNRYMGLRSPELNSVANDHFQRANALDPSYKLGLVGMLQLDCLSQRPPRTNVFEDLVARVHNFRWGRLDPNGLHAIAEMVAAKSLCLDRKQMDRLFTAATSNKSASITARSIILSDYAMYLWLDQKDYAAAFKALYQATSDNPSDVLNRLNLLQLFRLMGNREGTLEVLRDLEKMTLGRKDQLFFQGIKKQLVSDGVL